MDAYKISSNGSIIPSDIPLSSSKSESNRVLIINALGGGASTLDNLSDARDTDTMQRLLGSDDYVKDVLDAGTTMRFMTAFLAMRAEENEITGTARMKKRPIKLLVDALRELGASIDYLGEEGYPPLKIQKLTEQKTDILQIPGNISSQYISALLMIAPTLPDGLTIELTGEIFSRPYIEMTLGLMKRFGVQHEWSDNKITVSHQTYSQGEYTVESDWSGASYWYSMVALSKSGSAKLLRLRENSFQGDIEIAKIMDGLGVKSEFVEDGVILTKKDSKPELNIDFRTCPDLAQTVMAVATVIGTKLNMTGLESLRIKETDRIAAMQAELAKVGGTLIEDNGTWTLTSNFNMPDSVTFDTYEDHRMAMALAPLALCGNVIVREPDVVNKSYPKYWEHLKVVGFKLENV